MTDDVGYEGVTVAGIAVVRHDGESSVFLAQRSFDETDDPEVRETWEFPGGHLNPDEDPFSAASREFGEEIGFPLPEGEVTNGWRSETGEYQCFVYEATEFPALTDFTPTKEVQAVGWFTREMIAENENLRPEVRDGTDWDLVFGVSGNEDRMDDMMEEPELSFLDLASGPLMIHGVLAPEDVETGDGRGFNAGSMTARPYRLPFAWQKVSVPGHDGSFVVGSVDRLMRKGGLIHYQGLLMPTADAGEFCEYLAFFGRVGVSVDGEKGAPDMTKTSATGVLWFEAVRAAGLTAVAIPAFSEAYVAFGPHPEMPDEDDEEFAVLRASGDLVTFDRGPGWVTNPKETKRLHDYWTKKGQPGYKKIGWGTPGDFTRAKKLIGQKIAANSPEDMKYLNQIIAQWHHDALGYWPGELGKPGNAPDTPENRKRAARHATSLEGEGFLKTSSELFDEAYREGRITELGVRDDGVILYDLTNGIESPAEGEWEAVLRASGARVLPPIEYFHKHSDSAGSVVDEPDANGYRRCYGYAAEWGVCHIGYENQCVEPPRTFSDDYPAFHKGRTKVDGGFIPTGVLTYNVEHRNAKRILTESATQAHFDNLKNAWAAVRIGEDENGIWYSGVVLPKVDEEDLVKIEASGQVSGEWKYDELRALLTVNVEGFAIERASAEYDDEGNVIALAASAFGQVKDAPCKPTPADRMAALRQIDAEVRFNNLKERWAG